MPGRDDLTPAVRASSILAEFEAWRRRHPLLTGDDFGTWWADRVQLGLTLHGTPIYEQLSFRIRDTDTVAHTSSTFSHAENTNATITITGNRKFRIRWEIDETAGAAQNNTFHLYVSKNGGAYTQVTAATSNVRATPSSQYADDATPTSNLLTTSTRGFDNRGVADGGDCVFPTSGNISFPGNSHIEVETCLELVFADLANNDTLDFRLRHSSGAVLDVYTRTPRITISKATTYNETGRLVTVAATVTATDVQRYVENRIVTAAATVTASDVQRYVENRTVTVAATVTATDQLAGGIIDETGRLVTVAATVTATDVQRYVEALTVSAAATATATDVQRYVEALTVSAAATVTVSDLMNPAVEALTVSAAATVTVSDLMNPAVENVTVVFAATVTSTDVIPVAGHRWDSGDLTVSTMTGDATIGTVSGSIGATAESGELY